MRFERIFKYECHFAALRIADVADVSIVALLPESRNSVTVSHMVPACIRSFLGWSNRKSLGAHGEDLAAKFLMKRGYRILDRNLKLVDDEADLVAIDPDGRTVVIVEVKTRQDDAMAPEWSIHQSKQARMARLASRLQRRALYRDRPFRFDAIAVVIPPGEVKAGSEPVIRHHVGAFASPW